jgi:hypothetical protein
MVPMRRVHPMIAVLVLQPTGRAWPSCEGSRVGVSQLAECGFETGGPLGGKLAMLVRNSNYSLH